MFRIQNAYVQNKQIRFSQTDIINNSQTDKWQEKYNI